MDIQWNDCALTSIPWSPCCQVNPIIAGFSIATKAHRFIGLLQTLDDCGSPPLASRAPSLSRPTSLRTSDRKSMMSFMGLPLDIFGKVSYYCLETFVHKLMLSCAPGCLLPTISSITTAGYAQRKHKLALWKHQLHSHPAERD